MRFTCGARTVARHGAGVIVIPDRVALTAVITPHPWLSYDWLTLSPPGAGQFAVDLTRDGAPLEHLEIDAVLGAAIAELRLHAVDEAEVAAGEARKVALLTVDAAERPIYGVAAEWSVNDRPVSDKRGDIFGYTRDPERRALVTAAAEGRAIALEIHGVDAFVRSSNDVDSGCAAGSRSPAPWVWLIVVVALGRRRRPTNARTVGR